MRVTLQWTKFVENIETASLKERAKKKLERDAGPLIIDALNDPQTVELMCNGDGKLWVEKLGQPMSHIGTLRPAQAESIIKTVAGFHGKEVTRSKPLLEGEWPLDGSRFAGQLPPVVRAATFAIRKKAVSIYTLDQYVESRIMTPAQCAAIKKAIRDHRNILVIGGTGTGKTTLVNAVINEMVVEFPSERVFIIEDTGEIQCAAANFVQYHTTLDVSMTHLLRTSLRMRPDSSALTPWFPYRKRSSMVKPSPYQLPAEVANRLVAVVGEDAALRTQEERDTYRDPYWHLEDRQYDSSLVLFPSTREQVQEIVRIANENGTPLWTSSQGRNNGYGGPSGRVQGSVLVSLRRMNKVLHIDRGEPAEDTAHAVDHDDRVDLGHTRTDLARVQARRLGARGRGCDVSGQRSAPSCSRGCLAGGR